MAAFFLLIAAILALASSWIFSAIAMDGAVSEGTRDKAVVITIALGVIALACTFYAGGLQ